MAEDYIVVKMILILP